jgi:hypothetical protein
MGAGHYTFKVGSGSGGAGVGIQAEPRRPHPNSRPLNFQVCIYTVSYTVYDTHHA